MNTKRTAAFLSLLVPISGGFLLSGPGASAAPISVSSYTYGANAESQPQPTSFQMGLISDVGNVKLTDDQLATGGWNDGTNVGYRNDTDNGNPQPQVTLDLGAAHNVTTVDIWTVSDFLGSDESVSISSSTDGVSFSTPVTVNPIVWTGGFANAKLRQGSIDVSSLPDGQFLRVEVFDSGQWMMINEIQLDGTASGPDTTPPTLAPGDIVDDQSGGPVNANNLVTYTLTFSEDMDDSSVDSADFDNAGTSAITIGSITETTPGVFTIEVTPTNDGTLQLRVPSGATLNDAAGNPRDTTTAILDDTTITVEAPDTTDPTLAGTDIVDNKTGAPVNAGNLVVYTITCSEDMDETTVDAADFGNAGTSAITTGTITETSPGVFNIEVTPTEPGTLQFEVVTGAALADPSGNPLDTSSAIVDDTTLTVNAAVVGPLAAAGWNRDFVLGSGETHAAHDKPENPNIWFADNLGIAPGPGIPASGAVSVAGTDFQFEPFTGGTNNAVRAPGTLTLGSPGRYAEVSFLVANTGGSAGTWTVTLNFSDAAPVNTTYSAPVNWANAGGEFDPTLTDNGTTSGFAGSMEVRTINLDALGLSVSTLASLEFLGDDGASGNAAVFALTGTGSEADTTPPTLASSDIVDDQAGGPVLQGLPVVYTVSFSESMDGTSISAADFGNAGTAGIAIGTISLISPGGYAVEVTPTSTGTLQLEISAGAVITDPSGNPLDTSSAIADDTIITVDPPDTTNPALSPGDIVDDQGGGPVNQGTLVTYTVSFSEDIDETTVSAADFGNGGTSSITLGSIVETSPGVFSVEVTPSDPGTLQLEVLAGAVVTDPSGNPLDTASAIVDDTTLTVENPFPGSVSVSSYTYGANPESQPQPTNFQGGSISDVGNVKLTDGIVATSSWNDFTNVGFRNDTDNGAPQPQVDFDLGALQTVATVDLFTVSSFLGGDESVAISSSVDGVTFSTAVTVDPVTWTGGFSNVNLRQTSIDVSSLPAGQFYRLEVFDPGQWMMINEVVFYPAAAPDNDFATWIAGFPGVGGLTGFDDDADGDGNGNGLENFFGTAPDVFSAGILAGTASGNTFLFSHPQSATPADDLSGPEYTWSTDLQAFHANGDTVGGSTVDIVPSVDDPVAGTTTVTATVSGTALPQLFLRVGVSQIIPPPPLLSEDFEADDGGFTIAVPNKGTGTEWAHGAPASPDQGGGGVTAGNNGSGQCWGTNLTGGYTAGTDACLRSPVIDLTTVAAAELSFALSIDADSGHTYEVNVIEAASDAVIVNVLAPTEDGDINNSDWATMGGIAIPAAAIGQSVRLEWRFTGEGDGMFNGAYLDDVVVTETTP